MRTWIVKRSVYEDGQYREVEERVRAESSAHDSDAIWFYKLDEEYSMRLVAGFRDWDSVRLVDEGCCGEKCCGDDSAT